MAREVATKTLEDTLRVLQSGLDNRPALPEAVREFQAMVKNPTQSGLVLKPRESEILGNLAWDLDFCGTEADLVREIETSLERLREG